MIAPPPPRTAPPPPIRDSICDTECYKDYWLCSFDTGEEFELYPGHPLDIAGLQRALSAYRVITFNGQHYDMPIIALALQGATNEQLKQASDALIVYGMKSWDIAEVPRWINHVDLFDVAPGQGSLKIYGGKMHSRKMQDLPIDPAASITPEQRAILRTYCRNDLRTTRDLLETFPTQLELRETMGADYGIDLRSKSDAQIAEAVMKTLLPFKVQRPPIQPGAQFFYRPPEWLSFVNLDVLALLARSPFTIADSGSPVMTDELANALIRIGGSAYQLGSGGLHSTESKVAHFADADHTLSDHDVASYYPSLILRTGIYPQQIGATFTDIYRGWYDARLAAKHDGRKKVANSLKTLLNGTFGKLGSPWSIFYAPAEMIQVTITGQLALLMLIEMLELVGVSVISANTDGIVLKTRRSDIWLRDSVVTWWEQRTGFVTEFVDRCIHAARDVNSYVAVEVDGQVKTKGAYAPPEPGPSGWPNPTGQISVDAVTAYLSKGTPMRDTVYACRDIRQFVHVRAVKGGGSYAPGGQVPAVKAATQKHMRQVLGWPEKGGDKLELLEQYGAYVTRMATERVYLGKAVRWYYGTGSRGCIVTSTGGLVATSEGCVPCMELPDELPADVDYEAYVQRAVELLADLGVGV